MNLTFIDLIRSTFPVKTLKQSLININRHAFNEKIPLDRTDGLVKVRVASHTKTQNLILRSRDRNRQGA